IGGTANLLGSVLGATILTLVSYVLSNVINLSSTVTGYVQLFIYGVLIIAFMMLLPQGLLRERWTLERLWARLRHHPTASDEHAVTAEELAAATAAVAIAPVNG